MLDTEVVTVLTICRIDKPELEVKEESHTSGQAMYARVDFAKITKLSSELDLPIEVYLVDEYRCSDSGEVLYADLIDSYRNPLGSRV